MKSIYRSPLPTLVSVDNRNYRNRALDEDICVHIFTSSSVMVGVCLTVVGILRVVIALRSEDVLGDDLLSINAMLYLLSALLSYWALRTRNRKRNHRIEYAADGVFIVGMIFTVINTGFITWAMTAR
jgi:urea transporter